MAIRLSCLICGIRLKCRHHFISERGRAERAGFEPLHGRPSPSARCDPRPVIHRFPRAAEVEESVQSGSTSCSRTDRENSLGWGGRKLNICRLPSKALKSRATLPSGLTVATAVGYSRGPGSGIRRGRSTRNRTVVQLDQAASEWQSLAKSRSSLCSTRQRKSTGAYMSLLPPSSSHNDLNVRLGDAVPRGEAFLGLLD